MQIPAETAVVHARKSRAHSSAGERSLHTGEVQGSIPCAPTRTFNKIRYFFSWCTSKLADYRHLHAEQSAKWRALPCKIRAVCSCDVLGTGCYDLGHLAVCEKDSPLPDNSTLRGSLAQSSLPLPCAYFVGSVGVIAAGSGSFLADCREPVISDRIFIIGSEYKISCRRYEGVTAVIPMFWVENGIVAVGDCRNRIGEPFRNVPCITPASRISAPVYS